jgi:asparagine synthase (glutamine-hydrolysing)
MCGINGFQSEDRDKLVLMNKAVAHRGPDAEGVFVERGISLGHTRLSILDTREVANQPMHSRDGRFILVFNGEIYNFQELREEIGGDTFQTSGDTEVLLRGYEKWGSSLFARLSGIFALAIYDREKGVLTLARDQVGVKPLYYYEEGEHMVFSSEIKALLSYGVKPELNLKAFDAYMRLLFVPGEETMFKNINRVPPGSFCEYREGEKLIFISFVKEEVVTPPFSFSKAKRDVQKTIDEAVKRQLISDRPLGIYLSGGFDSTIILDSVRKLRKEVNTFSIGFDLGVGEESLKFNRDFDLAMKSAEHYSATHTGFKIKKGEVLEAFKEAITSLDEPVSNPTSIPMILLSKRVKEAGVDVVLGGDGGDELFGGYERYVWAYRRDLYMKYCPSFVRSLLRTIYPKFSKLEDKTPLDKYGRFMFQKEDIIKEVTGSAYRDGKQFKNSFTEKFLSSKFGVKESMLVDEKTWLVNESLLRSDKLSMAHGIELRVPFLDNEVVSLAHSLPVSYKVGITKTKHVLKEAFRGRLPESLFSEPKRGWFSPGAKWLRDENILSFAREVFTPGYHEETDHLFDWKEVEIILNKHVSKEKYNLTVLWAILTFRVWAKTFSVKVKD